VKSVTGALEVSPCVGSDGGAKPVRDFFIRQAGFDAGREHALEDEEPLAVDIEPLGFGRSAKRTIQHGASNGRRGKTLTGTVCVSAIPHASR
jgi:hypothetical protein